MKEGWEYKKLGLLATYINGFAFAPNDWSTEGKPIIRIQNLTDKSAHFNRCVRTDIPKKYKVVNGDVLISWSATLGVFEWDREDSWLNQHIFKVVFDKIEINKQFFKYIVETSLEEMSKHTNGATMKHIRKGDFDNILVPIPPLKNQEEIATYLDSAFAKIDAMKANAEKALDEAKALFQASLKEMLEPKEGWEETTIGDICEIIRGKRFVRADIVEDGIPCIHYGDIYTYYGLSATKTRGFIKQELAKKMRFANKNDVVVVQAGENNWDIGVGVAYFGEEPAAVHDACFILKHKQDPMYISYYLRSYDYHWYLLDYVHEGKICSFLKPALENAPIPLPPISEQQSIVATLNDIKSKVDHLQTNYNKITQECDTLKQAILRQVFE